MIRLNNNTIFIEREGKLQMVTSEIELIRLAKKHRELTRFLIILKALNDTQEVLLKLNKIEDKFYEITGQDIKIID